MSGQIAKLLDVGYALRTVYPRATGQAGGQYNCILQFKGNGHLDVMRATVVNFGSAPLAGAWNACV